MPVRATIDERLVVETWERQAFDSLALSRLDLTVVYRGVPSDAGGPDYQEAVLARPDGSLLRGDIEFHVFSSDWGRHGHGRDPRYNDVVLHVVWEQDDDATIRADGVRLPVVSLSHYAFLQTLSAPATESTRLWPHPCIRALQALTSLDLIARIHDLGKKRFDERADILAAEVENVGHAQALYAAVLEAMGYASNRGVFRLLAETVPLGWLMSIPVAERLPTILAAAGLGPTSDYLPPAYLPHDSWRLARLRPGNHPAVRLAGAVALLNRLEPDPVQRLIAGVAEAPGPRGLRRMLTVRSGATGLIGTGRADELAASVILPFVAAVEPDLPGVRAMYDRYPSPPSTRWTHAMLRLLTGAGHEFKVTSAPRHQGVHLLYTRYCRRETPADCPVCRGGRATGQER